MSMYSNQKYNRFVGKFSDLAELQSQRPTGEDGEWAVVLDVNKEYYWDISVREWTAGNGSQLATEETLSEVKTAIQNISSDEWQSNLGIDSLDATYYYFGFTLVGSTKWRIKRMKKDDYSIDWATGDTDPATNWADRGSLTYSITI